MKTESEDAKSTYPPALFATGTCDTTKPFIETTLDTATPVPSVPDDKIRLSTARPVTLESVICEYAANEVAVSSFLNGDIKFSDIYSVLKRTFDIKEMSKKVELESIYEMDKETRKRAKKVIESLT